VSSNRVCRDWQTLLFLSAMRPYLKPLSRLPALLFLSFVLVFSPRASGQAAGGSISGQLQIIRGNFPKEAVLVSLVARGATVGTMYADNEGHFGFSNLSGNIYHLVINDQNYLPVDETVVIDPTTPIRILTIRLSPRDKAKASSDGGVSGGNPYLTSAANYNKPLPAPARKEFQAALKSDQQHKPEDAIKHYQKALEIAPDFYPARNNLGTTLLNTHQYDEAEQQFKEVIKTNPSDAAAYFNLGNLYLLTHREQEAMQWVNQGLNDQPDSAFGQFLKGAISVREGNAATAETSLRRSLQIDPTMAKAHLELVNLYLQQDRQTDAIGELKVFLKSFPRDPLVPQVKKVLDRLQGSPLAPRSK
jgi:Flp pilus assembly protein TadD